VTDPRRVLGVLGAQIGRQCLGIDGVEDGKALLGFPAYLRDEKSARASGAIAGADMTRLAAGAQ